MKSRILFSLLFLVSISSIAQVLKPAKWNVMPSKQEVKMGETIDLIIYADVDKGWYIYAAEKSEAEYAPQTIFTFEEAEKNGYKLVGNAKSIGAKEKMDEYAGGKVKYLTGRAEFRQKIKIIGKVPKIIFSVEAQVCSTSCVPVSDNFEITNIKVTEGETKVEPKGQLPSKDTIKGTGKVEPEKIETPAKSSAGSSKRVAELEKEKQKYTKTDKQGNDESVKFLKEFVNKYGK